MNKRILITIIGIIGIAYFVIERYNLINKQENIELIEKKNTTEFDKNDCVFDFNTQTDNFIKEIPEFSNYVWDNKQKKAIVTLNNENKLIIIRGGCDHFSFSGNLILMNSELDLNDESEIFKNTLWIAKKLFIESNFEFIEESLNKRKFEIDKSENQKSYYFQTDRYCDMSLIVKKINNNQMSIEIGYSVC